MEQEHLVLAQSLLWLAMDEGAMPQERQSAYRKAQKELEGLILLPCELALDHVDLAGRRIAPGRSPSTAR